MRVLITGAHGLLGAALAPCFAEAHEVHAVSHAALDITDREAVNRTARQFHPGQFYRMQNYEGTADVVEGRRPSSYFVRGQAQRANMR